MSFEKRQTDGRLQMNQAEARRKLIKLLQNAHAGERAAALAYQGEARILKIQPEIQAIRQIEADEWRHRAEVFEILRELNAKPAPFREVLMLCIGTVISFGCMFCRRYWATYFAGILEHSNVQEYAEARKYAEILELESYAKCFREMELTEFRHEQILQKMIAEHWLLPVSAFVFRWGKEEKFIVEG